MSEPEAIASDLLRAFFSACEREFRFMEQRHDYSYISGLAEYNQNYQIIKPFTNHLTIDGPFLGLTRYEKDDTALEILFGDEAFLIEGYVHYKAGLRFELSEILSAAKKPIDAVSGDWGMTRANLIDAKIETMANAARRHAKYILNPSDKLLKRALTMRNARLEHNIRQHYADVLESACEEAAHAYRNKLFNDVIALLEPFKDDLGTADLKKLERAKKSLPS